MSQLEKVGLLVYIAIKSGMLSPGKEYDFDFTMSSWNQKLGRQSLPTKALWDTDLVCSPDRYQNWSRNVIRNRESFLPTLLQNLLFADFRGITVLLFEDAFFLQA